MHGWRSLGPLGQLLVGIIAFWLILSPFIAGRFADPVLFMNTPFLLVIGTIVLLGAVAWVLRKLGH